MADQQHCNCISTYTVQTGDSYFSIAQKLNVDLLSLLAANPGTPPAVLTVGDQLCVPQQDVNKPAQGGNTSNQPAQSPENTPDSALPTPSLPDTEQNACPANRRTVVQPNQTAEELQLKYGLSFYTLQEANPTQNLDALQTGDILCIPEENVPCPVPNTYTLKADETLETAAMALRVPVATLLRANPCLAPGDFTGGVSIRIPNAR